jgi:hypothetical protein
VLRKSLKIKKVIFGLRYPRHFHRWDTFLAPKIARYSMTSQALKSRSWKYWLKKPKSRNNWRRRFLKNLLIFAIWIGRVLMGEG